VAPSLAVLFSFLFASHHNWIWGVVKEGAMPYGRSSWPHRMVSSMGRVRDFLLFWRLRASSLRIYVVLCLMVRFWEESIYLVSFQNAN